MNLVKTVRTVTVIEETITVAAVPMPAPEPRPFPRSVKVDLPPVAPRSLPYSPKAGDRVLYTGPNGASTYKVVWVGMGQGRLRVKLVGFGGRVAFFTDANKVRLA